MDHYLPLGYLDDQTWDRVLAAGGVVNPAARAATIMLVPR